MNQLVTIREIAEEWGLAYDTVLRLTSHVPVTMYGPKGVKYFHRTNIETMVPRRKPGRPRKVEVLS